MWEKGSRGKVVGVVPGGLILEGWAPDVGQNMPHSPQEAGTTPASACLPEEWGAYPVRGPAPLLPTNPPGPRRSKSHLLPGLIPLSPNTNITAPAG